MRFSFQHYLRVFAGITVAGLVSVIALNLLVDPLGAYPQVSLKAFEPYRRQWMSRPAKAEMLLRQRGEVVLLGTSRIQAGIPVEHPAYGTTNVLNLGLAGTTLPEVAAVLEFALRHQPPRLVLLGTDFFLFSDVRGLGTDFDNSRFNPGLQSFDYHCKNALGSQMSADSWMMLRQRLRDESPPEAGRGFLSKTLRPGASQRDSFVRGVRRFLTEPEVYGAYHYSTQRLDVFRRMLRRCRQEKVELMVFIPPVHALELETVRAAGLWPTFERWKSDLVRILAEEGAAEAVPLWDFTGFTGVVAEGVPDAGDRTTRMRWHFEHSHFTPALGGLVLHRLLSQGSPPADTPGIGERLTAHNIAAHLARLRTERDSYAESHPAEVDWISRLAKEVKAGGAERNPENRGSQE